MRWQNTYFAGDDFGAALRRAAGTVEPSPNRPDDKDLISLVSGAARRITKLHDGSGGRRVRSLAAHAYLVLREDVTRRKRSLHGRTR